MGPTASGKSDAAVALARRFGGEIVNSDSMQVYRYLPIGTAAPTAEMYAAAPHHLFEYREPDDECDAGAWAREAAAVIRDIVAREKVPVVVGGTFFWTRTLFEGLSAIPPASDDARQSVAADLAAMGSIALHRELAAVDHLTASRLVPGDSQRIARALEVFRTTGVALSDFHRNAPVPAVDADVLRLKLSMDRRFLYDRINRRLRAMIDAGLVDEVANVLRMGFARDCRPLKSSSFVPVIQHLDGLVDINRMAIDIAQGHRNYAKRQITWLRRENGVEVAAGNTDALIAAASDFLGA